MTWQCFCVNYMYIYTVGTSQEVSHCYFPIRKNGGGLVVEWAVESSGVGEAGMRKWFPSGKLSFELLPPSASKTFQQPVMVESISRKHRKAGKKLETLQLKFSPKDWQMCYWERQHNENLPLLKTTSLDVFHFLRWRYHEFSGIEKLSAVVTAIFYPRKKTDWFDILILINTYFIYIKNNWIHKL